jgi:hypothetical protein
MKRNLPSLRRAAATAMLLGALMLAASLSGAPQEISNPPAREYVSFKLISDRNIFNASRARRGSRPTEERRQARIETITLVGTMSYEKGYYAFFDDKVLERGKTIAQHKILEVDGRGVKLEAGTNTIELLVGMQMRREEEGSWEVVQRSAPAVASSGTSGSSSASGASDAPGDESDIVKRLMRQREQELQ